MRLMMGDCLEQMKELGDNSVDSIVTDPPYGISFMAKKWDYSIPSVDVWREAIRVLKPGGHMLCACGTRTQHRMVCNIEDAGFEIRDVVSWIYGSGFPKSLNVSKAIDKAAGVEREVVGTRSGGLSVSSGNTDLTNTRFTAKDGNIDITAPATDEAQQWDGWGTALKPACEFFTLCRKPLSEKTVAANVLKWGTGGINVDGCRVEAEAGRRLTGGNKPYKEIGGTGNTLHFGLRTASITDQGRFPANLIHDGSDEVLAGFPETKSGSRSGSYANGTFSSGAVNKELVGDQGTAARFFYCAKASKKDRGEGNKHPTVKPTALMQYLCRLITPPGGVIIDPFMGSGSTGKAAVLEGFDFVGIELSEEYYNIAARRIQEAVDTKAGELF